MPSNSERARKGYAAALRSEEKAASREHRYLCAFFAGLALLFVVLVAGTAHSPPIDTRPQGQNKE